MTERTWVTSRACNGGTCVEFAADGNTVLMRDATHSHERRLTREQWEALLALAKNGSLEYREDLEVDIPAW